MSDVPFLDIKRQKLFPGSGIETTRFVIDSDVPIISEGMELKNAKKNIF